MPTSPQTLSIDDRRRVAGWAADCAEHVLDLYESAEPGDDRVRAAIDQARAFSAGNLDVREAIRTRGGQAGAAARATASPAAKAAAYAAEQAAAVAHMGAHALGAAGYTGKASALAGHGDQESEARESTHVLVAMMSDEVARVIASLPRLGHNASGPLAAGRLSAGLVGVTIQQIQALSSQPH